MSVKTYCIALITIFLMNCSGETVENVKIQQLVSTEDFESTVQGKETALYTLQNEKGMQVAITNYGGRIVSWLAPDKNGEFDDIVLGFNSIDGYLNANEVYYGALIGRVGNRIDEGEFSLDGKQYSLPTNNGTNHLHGGPKGFHNVVWEANQIDDQHLVLQYISEDGEQGYPGTLSVQVQYILTDDNDLKIDYTATTNQKTVVNLTNHAFFNLGGSASGTINDHQLMINAAKFTPVDSTLIPSGEIAVVENTPFDFTTSKAIGQDVGADNTQLEYGKGYDHNFVLSKKNRDSLTLAARVTDPESGRIMEIHTTEPGIQFYGGNFLDGSDVGKKDKPFEHRTAFCLEPQHFPDAPNNPDFPSVVLEPDSIYNSLSIYRLRTE